MKKHESLIVTFGKGDRYFNTAERFHMVTSKERQKFLKGLEVFSGAYGGASVAVKPEAVIEAIDLHHLAHGAAINVYSELLHLVMGEDEGYVVNKKAARNIRASLQTQLDEQIIAIHTTNNALPKALQSAVKGSHSMPALKKEYSIQK